MRRRVVAVLTPCLLAFALAAGPAFSLELHDGPRSKAAVTVPDTWALSTDGAWALADSPEHQASVRIAAHALGPLADAAAEAYLIGFIAPSWGTYTVDRHVHHVTCGRWSGVELYGHGSGDGWERARFHAFLLVETASPQKGVIVLITGRTDTWDAFHPALDRAVHAIHTN
jgi:hypothetical protein